MKKSIIYLFTALLFVTAFQSCKSNSDTKVNSEISSDTRAKIAELNKKLFEGIVTNNVNAVKSLLSPDLLKRSGSQLDMVIDRVSKRYPAKDFEILDEYLSTGLKKKDNDTVSSKHGNDNDYTVGFKAMNDEMYTSVLLTKGLAVNGAILAVYGKYGDDWKINILQMGDYSIIGKNAVDYYKEAKTLYSKGNLVDAADMIVIASQLVSPGGNYFSYKNESEIHELFSKIVDEANASFKLPVVINQVKTTPQIFEMSPQVVEEPGHQGVFPLIKYKSSIKLSDTVALKAENMALQQNIGSLFKGIDQNNQYILYQAYNGMPDGKTETKHYGFIQKLR
ncbi:hypothetical protein ACFS5N_06435 [Mucilaginibacter ximonensis]|uniref:Uncharacterized protein n=1 Tax=Mucilaginibacter ximonensis TaxID=538021 RepID=A0ABW5YA11_9SPHI